MDKPPRAAGDVEAVAEAAFGTAAGAIPIALEQGMGLPPLAAFALSPYPFGKRKRKYNPVQKVSTTDSHGAVGAGCPPYEDSFEDSREVGQVLEEFLGGRGA